jgi:Fic-DOC domain mobile mystery protein B
MGINDLIYLEGQTPLDPDEQEGLLITSITTREELNEWEHRNIEKAIHWTITRRKRFTAKEILTEQFIYQLHKRMFGDIWQWAGTLRKSNKNIGVDKFQISSNLKMLLDDCQYWLEYKSFSEDEIAIRFKHRIVCIHCFANGNGRHSRLIADIIIEKILGRSVFSWGNRDLIQNSTFRSSYLNALKQADLNNLEPLILFARS